MLAEYLLLKGTLEFKEGNFIQAKADIAEARAIIQQILVDINYEKLKTETFYFDFIVDFILGDLVDKNTQQYFDRKRVQNILQATLLFGGEEHV